jgi:hypothetical protein
LQSLPESQILAGFLSLLETALQDTLQETRGFLASFQAFPKPLSHSWQMLIRPRFMACGAEAQ